MASPDARLCTHCGLPVPAAREASGDTPAYCCFGCSIAAALTNSGGEEGPTNPHLLRLGVGIFLALNVMVFNWLFYSDELFGGPGSRGDAYRHLAELFAWLQLLLATGVMAIIGLPVLFDALRSSGLRRWDPVRGRWHFSPRIEPSLLISVAVASAFLLSAAHVVAGGGKLYFETVAGVLVLLTLGNYLEAGARRKATAAASLLADLPGTVAVVRDGRRQALSTTQLRRGDLVRARPGETVAVDGVVADGLSHIVSSTLTGESAPRSVKPGDAVLAGAGVVDGELWIEAQETGSGRVLARMEHLLERARQDRPPLHRLTARIALIFTPLVIGLALVVLAWHAINGTPAAGMLAAMSVLLISCPCALGLAAPLAAWMTMRRAAEAGILITSSEALERAARVDQVFFDKTGTLTTDEPVIERVDTGRGLSADGALSLAAAVESSSLHPIGTAILQEAERRGLSRPAASAFRLLPGQGVQAQIDGKTLRLGGERLLEDPALRPRPPQWLQTGDGHSVVYLADERNLLARFVIAETLRPEAAETIRQLRELGIEVEVLTGDGPGPAHRLENLLTVPVADSLLTADKMARLEAARKGGATAAMVGDGINDAAVLAGASLGVSVASATDLTHDAADVILRDQSLRGVVRTVEFGRHAVRRIRLTLAWAFGYNLIGVGLAAAGLLSPLFAASAMVVSSLLIIRLATAEPPAQAPEFLSLGNRLGQQAAPQTGVSIG